MALERNRVEQFKGNLNTVKISVLNTLQNKQRLYKYINTKEIEENIIVTTIKPTFWPLLLKTKFVIELTQTDNQVCVNARTVAQPKIKGDALKMYNGYINDFFSSLRNNS